MRHDNVFGHVLLSVNALTFESVDPESWRSMCRYIFRSRSGSRSKIVSWYCIWAGVVKGGVISLVCLRLASLPSIEKPSFLVVIFRRKRFRLQSNTNSSWNWTKEYSVHFYSASALLAMQSTVLARGILSVCLSFRHVPVLCPDEWRYDRAVFIVW